MRVRVFTVGIVGVVEVPFLYSSSRDVGGGISIRIVAERVCQVACWWVRRGSWLVLWSE